MASDHHGVDADGSRGFSDQRNADRAVTGTRPSDFHPADDVTRLNRALDRREDLRLAACDAETLSGRFAPCDGGWLAVDLRAESAVVRAARDDERDMVSSRPFGGESEGDASAGLIGAEKQLAGAGPEIEVLQGAPRADLGGAALDLERRALGLDDLAATAENRRGRAKTHNRGEHQPPPKREALPSRTFHAAHFGTAQGVARPHHAAQFLGGFAFREKRYGHQREDREQHHREGVVHEVVIGHEPRDFRKQDEAAQRCENREARDHGGDGSGGRRSAPKDTDEETRGDRRGHVKEGLLDQAEDRDTRQRGDQQAHADAYQKDRHRAQAANAVQLVIGCRGPQQGAVKVECENRRGGGRDRAERGKDRAGQAGEDETGDARWQVFAHHERPCLVAVAEAVAE